MNKIPDILYEDVTKLTIIKMKEFLKSVYSTNCFNEKNKYIEKIKSYKKVIEFTWREDQKKVIDEFIQFNKKYYVIHAVFGSGKTTLLLGMLIYGLLYKLYKPSEIMFISFNISIKNEIKRRLQEYGISSKVKVRTFDSIIYEISKATNYPYINLPNFEGKRKHVYKLVFDKTEHKMVYQPKIIYIDECQDLERQTLDILKYFYPNSKFIFAGDIFQSIQKEPRESILWYFMKEREDVIDTYKIYMNETPRVPKNILKSLQNALTIYYPEFKEQIEGWKSSNNYSNADIEWRQLDSYKNIFNEIESFCKDHKAEETMILTFSSAITVKGNMGDVARLRRFLSSNDYNINMNHKRMEPENYFLSTANSSKGLERDYVICFLTFPLEKAFINLSDDVVVNLITVALTRAKKKVILYVPVFQDKFSRVLYLFQNCPEPDKEKKVRNDKTLIDMKYQDYLDMEHTTTEVIRQSILKYDTRILLKEQTKIFLIEKIFPKDEDYVKQIPKLITEEEKSFVGVFIENLITSSWVNYFPYISDYRKIENNPMYSHCIKRISKLVEKYNQFKLKGNINDFNSQFEGIYLFAQIQIAISDKIIMDISPNTKIGLNKFWSYLKPKTILLKPQEGDIKVQVNSRMPWLTGVADGIIYKKVEYTKEEKNIESDEITIIEIKASQSLDWKDDALTQAIMYSLMTGKTWSRIILINPFMNERVCYYFKSKNILTLRRYLIQDLLIFNTNCMLSKLYNQNMRNIGSCTGSLEMGVLDNEKNKLENKIDKKSTLKITDDLLLYCTKNSDNDIIQINILEMKSPIKCEYVYNSFVKPEKDYEYIEDDNEISKIYRLRNESSKQMKDIEKEVNELLNNNLYKDRKIWMEKKYNFLKIKSENIRLYSDFIPFNNCKELFEYIGYKKNPELTYCLDLNDALYSSIFYLYVLSINQKLI